ncbi:MAG: 23S rRNA (cytidine(2498)-2'-O)-methyltransferase RlmM [Arenimonas sp.]
MESSTEPAADDAAQGLFAYCRSGFEPELAAELGERAALAGLHGHARTQRGSGLVEFLGVDGVQASKALPFAQLIFARQKLRLLAHLRGFDPKDRITPIMDALAGGGRHGELVVEHPDSDEARQLAGLARAFGNALRPALRKRGLLTEKDDARLPRLHVCLLAGDELLLGSGSIEDSSPWPMGVPRLRQSSGAPSRSAMKLEEAFLTLLTGAERERLIQPGMRATDLGAAPGGWSWVLAKRHFRVLSVDNGPIAESLLETGLVEHVRADGFSWKPTKAQDWLVCDMVESPRRVAARMAEWFAFGWCKHAVFNLKLPMKKRWDETRQCLDAFEAQAGRPLVVRARQLYHDREEVTVFATDPAARERDL